MKTEIKIGILGIVALTALILGLRFLRGNNVLQRSNDFITYYDRVDALDKSAPVVINGLNVGSITNMEIDYENNNRIKVEFQVQSNIKIPKNAKVLLAQDGIVGSKLLKLEFDGACQGNCAKSGDVLEGVRTGFVNTLLSGDSPENVVDDIKSAISDNSGESVDVKALLENLTLVSENLAVVTTDIKSVLGASQNNIKATLAHFNTISKELKSSVGLLNQNLLSLQGFTANLNELELANTIDAYTELADSGKSVTEELQTTVDALNQSMTTLNGSLSRIESGEGTLGALINDKSLFVNLEESTSSLNALLEDLKANPARYVSLSVFGKKNKE